VLILNEKKETGDTGAQRTKREGKCERNRGRESRKKKRGGGEATDVEYKRRKKKAFIVPP